MIEYIIELISKRTDLDWLKNFKRHTHEKKLVYTSFDGDYMHFMYDMMIYLMKQDYIPINPEATLGYYVSTTTHEGSKISVMQDCIKTELICDEMWVFNPINNHLPEGVIAEMSIWNKMKDSKIKFVPFFDSLNIVGTINVREVENDEICKLLEVYNKSDMEEIKNKLFLDNAFRDLHQAYIVANFYNFKHLDWCRAYCYENHTCPISPQNIMSYFLYNKTYKDDAKKEYLNDRLTLLDKAEELLFFTNTKKIEEEIKNLDIFSCVELLYWFYKKDKSKIKVVDWATANVPKYKYSDKWALTRTEQLEVEEDTSLLENLRKYEKEIKDDFNIFRGELLSIEVRDFIKNDSNAFLFGLISDQSIKAEIAWSLPYNLKNRIGYFDLNKFIENFDENSFESVLKEKPALHRYPRNIAKYLLSASKLLVEKYEGKAENIWKNQTAAIVIERLEEFKGISHKKAALGCLLLVRDFNVELLDKENINIVYDLHIRRIFLRAGFIEKDTLEDVFLAAKKIYPSFPGYLTSMFWAIGRDFCRPTSPTCFLCPIRDNCQQKIELDIKE